MLKFVLNILNFLNNNIGLITLLVGSYAIFLYRKQKRDNKKDAAKLILQEIRYAEQQIRIAKDHDFNYSLANKLLPTSSWPNNIHLFVNDLKEIEIDLISSFYSKASYIDILIKTISDFKSNKENKQTIGFLPQQIPMEPQQAPNQPSMLPPAVFTQELSRIGAQDIIIKITGGLEFIYNTPAIDKLRHIADRKWYHFFTFPSP